MTIALLAMAVAALALSTIAGYGYVTDRPNHLEDRN